MSFNISKRIYGGPIHPKIQDKLIQRQFLSSPLTGYDNIGSDQVSNILTSGTNSRTVGGNWADLSTRTPWVRMWCAIEQYEIDMPAEGELDEEGAPKEAEKGKTLHRKIYQLGNHIFNDYEPIRNPNSPHTFHNRTIDSPFGFQEDDDTRAGLAAQYLPDELGENEFLKPGAGITDVTVESTGRILGSLRKATVKFTVHNYRDFEEIYMRYFLKPGALMVLDIGWSTAYLEDYNP